MRIHGMPKSLAVVAGMWVLWVGLLGTVSAQGTWVEELGNFLAYYETKYGDDNWTPYNDELSRAREGVRAGDQLTVTRAMKEFQKLLRLRAYGINQAAAEDLYNLTLTIRPWDEPASAEGNAVELGLDQSTRMPHDTIQAPNKGGVRCHEGGCDNWFGDVSGPGAG